MLDSGNADLFFQNSCAFRSAGRHQEAALAQKELGMPHTHTHTHTHVNTHTHACSHAHMCTKANTLMHTHTSHSHIVTKNTQTTNTFTHTHTHQPHTHTCRHILTPICTHSKLFPSFLAFFFLFLLNLLFHCKSGNELPSG